MVSSSTPILLYLILPSTSWLSDIIYTAIYALAMTTLRLEYMRSPFIILLGKGLAFEILGVSTGFSLWQV